MKKQLITAISCISLLIIGTVGCTKKEQAFIHLNKTTATVNSNGNAKFKMKTNKDAKYWGLDPDNHNKILFGPKSTDNGDITITTGAGKYKIKVKKDNSTVTKTINAKLPKPKKQKTVNTNNAKPKVKKILAFGQPDELADTETGSILKFEIDSVQNVDPNNDMVTDISHNESDKKQFVIINYKVTAEKGTLDLDTVDGENLSVADSQNQIGSASSNRDNGIPDSLDEGQSISLRIGYGLVNPSNQITIKFAGSTWKGNIS